MLIYSKINAQLIHISNADKTSFYDRANESRIYPAFNVFEKDSNNNSIVIHFNDSLKFDSRYFYYNSEPKKSEHILREVYNNRYFVISILNYIESVKGGPGVMIRNNIYIVDLEKRDAIYKAFLNGIYVVRNSKDLEYCSKYEGCNYYIIKKIDIPKLNLTLLKADGKIYEFKLTKVH